MGGEAAQAAGGIPGINEGETVLGFPQQAVGRVVGELQLAFAAGTLGVQLFDAGADQAVEAVPDEVMNLARAGDADQTIALVVGVLQGAAIGTLAPDDLAEKVALETGMTPDPTKASGDFNVFCIIMRLCHAICHRPGHEKILRSARKFCRNPRRTLNLEHRALAGQANPWCVPYWAFGNRHRG